MAAEHECAEREVIEPERREPVTVVADRVVVEELGPQERLEAADRGAAAEACDGVDERDRDDLVLVLFFFE